jgi:hypothetical protein
LSEGRTATRPTRITKTEMARLRRVLNYFVKNGPDPRAGALGYFLALPTGASLGLRRDDALGQHRLDPAQRLAGPFLVLDEGEADVVVAVVAETDARRDGGFGFG